MSVGLIAMPVVIAINLVPNASNQTAKLSETNYTITVRDVLVNTMGTTIALTLRLAYLKYAIRPTAATTDTHGLPTPAKWTRSKGYRCRIALRVKSQFPSTALCRPAENVPARAFVRSIINAGPCTIEMRLIKNPTRFLASDTVLKCASEFLDQWWSLWLLHTCGGIEHASITVLFVLQSLRIGNHVGPSTSAVSTAFSVTALCATISFSLLSVFCCQRMLLRKLFTSFDFVFFYVQLVTEHLCVCTIF